MIHAAQRLLSSFAFAFASASLLTMTSAGAQSTLVDGTSVVATQSGLYLVREGLPAIQVCDTTPFGGGPLGFPSVTWIDGTNSFIVTGRELSAGTGGLWRVNVQPTGAGTVQDLTPAIPAGLGHDFVDADYSVGLDTLFLLERTSGRVLVMLHPATASAANLASWASVPPDEGVALAVRGAVHPFSVLVVKATGEVLRVDKFGATALNAKFNPSWTQIDTDPVVGTYFLTSQTQDKVCIGKPDGPSDIQMALISQNEWGFCGPLAQEPLDIEWDARAGRIVALAGDFVPSCIFGGGATGKNHVIRLPLAAGGPPSIAPVLLSALGDSGVAGSRGDLALVRHDLPDITWYGASGAGAGTSKPVFGGDGHAGPLVLGETAPEGLAGAPPSAAATLVIGLLPINLHFQGQLFGPLPQALVPVLTDAAGHAQATIPVPDFASLLGLRIYMQWWIDDTTTPAAGDFASSQVGIFTIGG